MASDGLQEAVHVLEVIQQVYCLPLKTCLERILPKYDHGRLDRFAADLRRLFTYTLPPGRVEQHLHDFFQKQVLLILGEAQDDDEDGMERPAEEIRQETIYYARRLQTVGLGDTVAQKMLANVMCETLRSHTKSAYSGRWTSPSTVVDDLKEWIEDSFARLAVELLAVFQGCDDSLEDEASIVPHSEVERWKEMGVNELGMLRTEELFDVAIEWDETRGAIEDLHSYVGSPAARTYLCKSFSNAIAHRLLQPGASTVEILQVYVAIIRAFTVLDSKGVLLDRVARPIRRYLRERDDTVNIVVGGLLADPDYEAEDEDLMEAGVALIELAREMNNAGLDAGAEDDTDLDFDDMNWLPDPIDAGPDYKKSAKTTDVIGSLISLFESKAVFIQEFQKILAERLLKQEYGLDREIRVLELLKFRFGENALQACEVMLRDILDSRRVDAAIQKDQQARIPPPPHTDPSNPVPELHARIVSHLFWPSLSSSNPLLPPSGLEAGTFTIPPPISALQSSYSAAFESLKPSRKLTWLDHLGQVIVNLDLEDRTVTETVSTYEAAVIYAFQPCTKEETLSRKPISRTLTDLTSSLSLSPIVLHNALNFWTSKQILHQSTSSPETYTVLETLPPPPSSSLLLTSSPSSHTDPNSPYTPRSSSTTTPRHHHPVSNVPTHAPSTNTTNTTNRSITATPLIPIPSTSTTAVPAISKFTIYKPYIRGMLTNAGPMALPQIAMMLRVVVPGGMPYGEGELRAWLEDEVRAGPGRGGSSNGGGGGGGGSAPGAEGQGQGEGEGEGEAEGEAAWIGFEGGKFKVVK